MRKITLILTLLSFTLSGCFWQEEEKRPPINDGKSPKMLFIEAKDEISAGTMDTAIALFEKLAKLEIAHALYEYEDYDLAIAKLDSYIRLYPEDMSSTPYAYYLRGVISEDKSRSILDGLITDNAQRDVNSVRDAFNYYLALMEKYPQTEYAEEAKDRLVVLRNILVRHELHVAIFYTKNLSPNSPSIPEALHLMAHNYDIIGAEILAKDVRRVLDNSYPLYKPKYSLED